jgi:phage-related protein
MTPPTLITTVNPSYSSSKETAYRIKKADFGDGYSQRTGDGVNTITKKGMLDFENLLPADADTLEAFLESMGGYLPFYYTLPLETAPLLWITIGSPKRTYAGPNSINLNVVIMQVFDIV